MNEVFYSELVLTQNQISKVIPTEAGIWIVITGILFQSGSDTLHRKLTFPDFMVQILLRRGDSWIAPTKGFYNNNLDYAINMIRPSRVKEVEFLNWFWVLSASLLVTERAEAIQSQQKQNYFQFGIAVR